MKIALCSTQRGNAEIIFVALLTTFVIGVGAAGIGFTQGISTDTSERMDSPEFELESGSDLAISYAEGPILNNKQETEAIKLFDGETEHILYDSESIHDLQPGDTLLDRDQALALGIETNSTVQIIWERKNGQSEVIDEIYIPDEDVFGSTYRTGNGTLVIENRSALSTNASY